MSYRRLKQCNACKTWFTVEDILYSPEIEPIGLTIVRNTAESIYFHFVHRVPGCGSSFLVTAAQLAPFVDELTTVQNTSGVSRYRDYAADLDHLGESPGDLRSTRYGRFLYRLAQNRRPRPVEMSG